MSPNHRPHLPPPSSILAGVVLMIALPLSAQAASYTYTAPAWAYREPLTAANLPKLGTTFKVLVPDGFPPTQTQTRTSYLLATGLTNPKVTIPGLGTVLTSAEILTWVPSGGTTQYLQMSFKIPNSSQLVGLRFYQQVLATQYKSGGSWCQPFCWTQTGQYLSRGGIGVIGS